MDTALNFTIPVSPRTKKNHSVPIVNPKTGYMINLPSKAYRTMEKEIVKFMKNNNYAGLKISTPINLQCHFYKDKDYKSDLTGYLQALQDALVKAEVLEDDNHKIVKTTNGSEVFLDRENPRIEVEITFYEERINEND